MENGGRAWLESAPPFEAPAIDERGEPLRIVTVDPRIFAIHKLVVERDELRMLPAALVEEARPMFAASQAR